MLRWPSKALESIATLFRPLQDIDVYVEDEGSEIFYLELLSRLTDGEFRVVRVLPLGGRRKVIEKCERLQGQLSSSLFIVDGDLEWVRGEDAPKLEGLHCHDAYCIENYLFCETAATELVVESHGKLSRDQAAGMLAWKRFLLDDIPPLVDLFSVFAAAKVLAPSVKTVGRGVGSILVNSKKGTQPSIDPARIEQLKREIESEIIAIAGKEALDREMEKISNRIANLSAPYMAVSGKDFLLPLLRFRMSALAKAHYPDESFRFRLAKHCSVSNLASLKQALRRAAQGRRAAQAAESLGASTASQGDEQIANVVGKDTRTG